MAILCLLMMAMPGGIAGTIRIQGVTITDVASATMPCGKDLIISVTDGDQYFVRIDYAYEGLFPYIAGAPMKNVRETRSGIINSSIGNGTYNGILTRVPAPNKGLICSQSWTLHWVSAVDNTSKLQRDRAADLQRKKEQELAAINRKKEEIAAGKLKSLEMMNHLKRLEEEAAAKRLAAYRASQPQQLAPGVGRCIINEPADITRCEQLKARLLAEQLARNTLPSQSPGMNPETLRIHQAFEIRQQQLAEAVDKAKRDMAANNCVYTASPLPPPVPYPNKLQPSLSVNTSIDHRNGQLDSWYSAALKDANSACVAMYGGAAPQITQQQGLPQGYVAPQMKSSAPSPAPVTVTAPTGNADALKNDNAQLQDMINNLK
jgi:hypothetical protein